jgi:hypothetical protein
VWWKRRVFVVMMVAFKFDIWETPADKITISVSTIGCFAAFAA